MIGMIRICDPIAVLDKRWIMSHNTNYTLLADLMLKTCGSIKAIYRYRIYPMPDSVNALTNILACKIVHITMMNG